jgi:hypothetical protein
MWTSRPVRLFTYGLMGFGVLFAIALFAILGIQQSVPKEPTVVYCAVQDC